ncbi:conserved hypothetical protein [Culex quinquefasciatus]|uniref:Uncharacterized protein n=1 Tax=Culex quinquefasciatus TaxID=7176 RepID=B0X6D7_CULQU|nr:conserved hypothetical protein [Culex quinquefasciatus]|eukprot:XP_001865209.1 conserved hypothetical protein [Culex quinquefasciatus]
MEMAVNGKLVPGLQNSGGPCRLHPDVVNRIVGMVPNQVCRGDLCGKNDAKSFFLSQIVKIIDKNNLPVYPSLLVNLDAKNIKETRRTSLELDVKSVLGKSDGPLQAAGEAKESKDARYAGNRAQEAGLGVPHYRPETKSNEAAA